ncbi:MAG TPA: LacI family transcriptional regulator [Candidatus Brachybacterium merdigallinarum]|nr:LacI family transcriptional regulator [Candidatus Brachybacterium merdigallinarum]
MAADRSPKAPRRPTISDVARRAGVSTGTVSRYLNGGHWVSAESTRSITRAIRETGYVANSTARQLRTGRSGTVAFIVDEPPARFFEDPNFEALVIEVGQALAARDQTMVLLLAGDEESAQRAETFLRTSGVDGAVTASAQPGHHLFERIQAAGIPLVNVGSPTDPGDHIAFVAADDREGSRLMAEHLLEQGARQLAVIAGPEHTPGGTLRLRAFNDAVDAARREGAARPAGETQPEGAARPEGESSAEGETQREGGPPRVVAVQHGDFTADSGRDAARAILEEHPRVDAIFAANDRMARGAIEVLRAAGREIPGDVLVGGFDDSAGAGTEEPRLTTVRQDFRRIAAELVDALGKQLDGGVRANVVVPVQLVVRDSTVRR